MRSSSKDRNQDLHHVRHPRDRYGRPLPMGSADQLGEAHEPEEVVKSAEEALEMAIQLFDAQRFFEAHQFFEFIWNDPTLPRGDRHFWQALTQFTAAMCHLQRRNAKGATTLLQRATDALVLYPRCHGGVDTQVLLDCAADTIELLREGHPERVVFPTFPRDASPHHPVQ